MERIQIWIKKNREILVLLLCFFLFLFIKKQGLTPKLSDENTYFLMAQQIISGEIPYKDFFHANPPLQIYILSFVGYFSNFSLHVLKLIPVIASIGSSLFIYLHVKNNESHPYDGLFAGIFFLFSSAVLLTSDHGTGVLLTILYLCASLYLSDKHTVFSGLLAAFSILTRIYGVIGVIAIGFYLLLKYKTIPIRYIASCTVTVISTVVLFTLITNGAFIDQIFLFRFSLIDQDGIPLFRILKFFFTWDIGLIVLGVFGMYLAVKKSIYYSIIWITLYLLFFALYSDRYYLYVLTLIVPLAISGGKTVGYIWYKSDDFIKLLLPIGIILYAGLLSINYTSNHAQQSQIPNLEEITSVTLDYAGNNTTLYGSFDITPLIALKTNLPIVHNAYDLNDKNFLSNTFSANKLTEQATRNGLIIFTTTIIENQIASVTHAIDKEMLAKHCQLVETWPLVKDYSNNAIVLFNCVQM